jgi:hypothetical protein
MENFSVLRASFLPRIKYGINSSRNPVFSPLSSGFPFSRLRAEALLRASTGMTNDFHFNFCKWESKEKILVLYPFNVIDVFSRLDELF